MNDDVQVRGLGELMDYVGEKRTDDTDPGPLLVLVGHVSVSVNTDGTVLKYIGRVSDAPVYRMVPRMYRVLEDGAIEICDDHPDWFEAGNDEQTTIDADALKAVIIAKPANDDLHTPASADNVLVFPDVKDGDAGGDDE